MADPGGAAGAAIPPSPTGPNSFVFAYIFAEEHPYRRLLPPSGKSWFRECKQEYGVTYDGVMDLFYTTGAPVLPTGMPDTQPEHHGSTNVTLLMMYEL